MSLLVVISPIMTCICGYVIYIFYVSFCRKQKHPEKSFKYCLINTLLGILRYFHLGFYRHGDIISIDHCLEEAMRLTKLTDFGDDLEFIKLYKQIQESPCHQKLTLTNIGYIAAYKDIITMFCARLKKVKYIKENPEVLNIPIKSPIFIFGLPRTGTTFLHRLLSLDPASRAPLLWELANATPLVQPTASLIEKSKCFQKRRNLVYNAVQQYKTLGDNSLTHIHEIDADLPEECLMTLREEIPISLQYLCTSYFLYDKDVMTVLNSPNGMMKAYKYYKQTLQLLTFQTVNVNYSDILSNNSNNNDDKTNTCSRTPTARTNVNNTSSNSSNTNTSTNKYKQWVLKCPFHMICIDEIKSIYPDAKLIWCHRHPCSAVPSLCSFLKGCHQTYFEDSCLDDFTLGQVVKKTTENWLKIAPKKIENSGLLCQHVIYNKLIENPIEVIREIYNTFDMIVTPEYEYKLNEYLLKNHLSREQLFTPSTDTQSVYTANNTSSHSYTASNNNSTSYNNNNNNSSNSKTSNKSNKIHKYNPSEYGLCEKELSQEIFKTYIDSYHLPMSIN